MMGNTKNGSGMNPLRYLGPKLGEFFVNGIWKGHMWWVFVIFPMIGGSLAINLFRYFHFEDFGNLDLEAQPLPRAGLGSEGQSDSPWGRDFEGLVGEELIHETKIIGGEGLGFALGGSGG